MSQPLSSVHSPGEQTTPRVSAYTDGGCDPNPGPGGWAVILRFEGREWTLSGNDPNTTNNRMEIQAAAAALALLEGLLGHCRVSLYTDSQYLRQGITEWIGDWVRRGWRTASGEPVKNQDLWRVLHSLAEQHDVTWHWLKGHAGHPLNERADRLATDALRSLQAKRGQDEAEHETIDDRPSVEISVKASARGAPGPAGWGAVLRMGEHTRTLSGRDPRTTANAMLIHGATAALQVLTRPCQVTVYSDAKYLIQGASQWVTGWQARGWQTRDGKRVANQEAWRALLEAARPHRVTWSLVQNEELPADLVRAGELAGEASGLEKEG